MVSATFSGSDAGALPAAGILVPLELLGLPGDMGGDHHIGAGRCLLILGLEITVAPTF